MTDGGQGPLGSGIDEEPQAPSHDVPWGWVDIVGIFAAAFLLALLSYVVLTELLPEPIGQASFFLSSLAALAVVNLVWIHRRYGAVRRLFGERSPSGRDVLLGVGGAIGAFLVVSLGLALLLTLAGQEPPEVQEDLRRAARDSQTAVFVIIGAVVLAPLAEELFYRGLLYQALRKRLTLWPAMGVSGSIFAIAHMQENLEGTLLLFAAFLPLGMFLAWLLERRGTLVAPLICHAIFNGIQLAYLHAIDRVLAA